MQYDVDNSVKSKYRIGSNTKAFSAAILMKMLDGKDLRQETIGDHLPWYPDNQCADVSLHHLLTMSSVGLRFCPTSKMIKPTIGVNINEIKKKPTGPAKVFRPQ